MKQSWKALTKADNVVISVLLCVFIFSFASCKDDEEPRGRLSVTLMPAKPMEDTVVTIRFSPFDISPFPSSTRAAVSEAATRLDLWIYKGTTEITAVHQTSEDTGFGTASVRLEKTKTYTLYATAHKGDGAATLSDGIISWPNDKIRDTFYGSTTFTPSNNANVSVDLKRIVAQLRLTTTDQVPDDVAKLVIEVASAHDRWSITSGAAHEVTRTSTLSPISTKNDGTATFAVSIFATDEQTLHDVTVTTYDSDDHQIQTRTFANVPFRNNYRTIYNGELFTNKAISMSFTLDPDWNEYSPVTF